MAATGGSTSSADVPDDVANRMSLFYANPTPMLNTLSAATEKLLQDVRMKSSAHRLPDVGHSQFVGVARSECGMLPGEIMK